MPESLTRKRWISPRTTIASAMRTAFTTVEPRRRPASANRIEVDVQSTLVKMPAAGPTRLI